MRFQPKVASCRANSSKLGATVLFPLLLCLSAAFLPAFASAEGKATPASTVTVGVYVAQIYEMSLKDNRFSADFYVWFRWKGRQINPAESFEIVNGRTESKDLIYEGTVEGFRYAVFRARATFTKFWDISRFPLDDHVMTIEIEDAEHEDHKLRYVADVENSATSPEVRTPGWTLSKAWAEVSAHGYKTNYGDISLPTGSESVYSRFVFSIQVARSGYGYFFKLFLSVFLATLISFLAFLIKPTELDPRFGLGVGAIFAAVASTYVLSSSLPETNQITMTDKLNILAILFIFLSLFESTISLKFFNMGKEKISRRMDHISAVVFTVAYVWINIRIISP